MIKLTNRAVQEDLFKILNVKNDPIVWHGYGVHKLIIKNNETTTTSYPYHNHETIIADCDEIIRIKKLLTI